MKSKKHIIFIVFTLLTFLFSADIKAQSKWSLEIDPATFMWNGYSAHLRYKPANTDHIQFGVGIYAMDMPNMLVNMNSKNKNLGWIVRIKQGTGLFGEYHFNKVNKGFLLGTQTSIQKYQLEKQDITGSANYTNGLVMGYGGYSIQPFQFPLYIKLWGGVGYTWKMSGQNQLGEASYDLSPLTMFGTMHLGYSF